jgi:predicted RND superfamily exporter protein
MNKSGSPQSNTSLSFGLEKIGLLPLRYPWLAALVLAAATGLAVFGLQRLSVADSLSDLFRTDTPAFNQYKRMSERFPTSEYDALIVL